jgi:hypothetical protein
LELENKKKKSLEEESRRRRGPCDGVVAQIALHHKEQERGLNGNFALPPLVDAIAFCCSADDGNRRIVVVKGSSVGKGGSGGGFGFRFWALAAASNVGLAIAMSP